MAKLKVEIPKELLSQINMISVNADILFGEMVKTGAEVVYKNIMANFPKSFADSDIRNCLKITNTYITPSDDGINVKVGFYGYFYNHKNQLVPAPLVANVMEYGRSGIDFPKHPFMRKSFRVAEIEKAMLDKQKELTGGLLE